jgi:ABC-type Fe3+/spermidine/putrescine transport system ATPase subunit
MIPSAHLVKQRLAMVLLRRNGGNAVSALTVTDLVKSYTPGARVLDGISLHVEAGAFFTLLGASGCGKTTLLRCIAGFLNPDSGRIDAGGERLDTVPAHRRDIGMVFQDYAIFPHLTVAENIGFGLKARRMPPAEIAPRVDEALRMVRLEGMAGRLPADLSGGQQQRVGLARAMAIRPKLLLMDEPLSNLDAKLRLELREDIRDLQRRLGITTIYVTHDQEEALAVSDSICVMHAGRIEQIAAPFALYRAPETRVAAAFVGSMNFLPARIEAGMLVLGEHRVPVTAAVQGRVEIAVRPEDVALGVGAIGLTGRIAKITFLGREALVLIETPLGMVQQLAANPAADLLGAEGSEVALHLPAGRIAVFAPDGRRVAVSFP